MTLSPRLIIPLIYLEDFRLISLVGSLYKLVAKELATRLGTLMDKLISSNQSNFWKGKMLVDEVVENNKVINLAKKSKKAYLILS